MRLIDTGERDWRSRGGVGKKFARVNPCRAPDNRRCPQETRGRFARWLLISRWRKSIDRYARTRLHNESRYNVIVETWLIYKPQIRGDPEFSTSRGLLRASKFARAPDRARYRALFSFPFFLLHFSSPQTRALSLSILS